MATKFNVIARRALKAVNRIKGASAAAQETAYNTDPLTTTQAASPVYNLSFVKDVLIDVHGRLATEIAMAADPVTGIGCHPWRSSFAGVTANVAHGGALPILSSTSKTIIGALGRPFDAADTDRFLQPASIERISAYRLNTGIYTNNPDLYNINGQTVYHTTTNIVFACCQYERADVAALVAANGTFGGALGTIPDNLADALLAGTVFHSMVEGEYMEMVSAFGTYFQAAVDAIRAGSIAMPGMPMMARRMAA